MKTVLTIFHFALTFGCVTCFADNWTSKSSVGGTQRNDAFGFSIDSIGKGYVGGGSDGTGAYLNDFWEYNPITDAWTQKTSFPGSPRARSFAFTIGSKGYVGGGGAGSSMYSDFWEYDPTTDVWTKKANLPLGPRTGSFAFSIGSKGYFGTGWDSLFNRQADFWEYDPLADTWTRKADFGGGVRIGGIGAGNTSKGYAGTGFGAIGAYSDFWEYDPIIDTWTQKANVGGLIYADAVSFSICDNIYVGTGEAGSFTSSKRLYEYTPTANSWALKATFIGSARDEAVGFSLLNKGYLGTGGSGLKDWYQYSPDKSSISSLKNDTICGLQSVTLNAGPALNYVWSTGATTSTINVNISGPYWVTIKVQECTITDTVNIYYKVPPLIDLLHDTNECGNAFTTFSHFVSASNVVSYNWNDGAATQNHSFSSIGHYWVNYTLNNGCVSKDSFTINLFPYPKINLGDNTLFCELNYTLNALNPNSSYIWNTGDTTSNITITHPGMYFVSVRDNNGCVASDTITFASSLSPYNFIFPNIVTPNSDGINDSINFKEYKFLLLKLEIFDRWGNKVFETSDPNSSWSPQNSDGTYYYCGKYKTDCNKEFEFNILKGFITLIR